MSITIRENLFSSRPGYACEQGCSADGYNLQDQNEKNKSGRRKAEFLFSAKVDARKRTACTPALKQKKV
jgi:hypothetical protein